jgi:hypothetical protein
MPQYADRMYRGGSPGPFRHVRALTSRAARVLALLAALLLAGAGTGAPRADEGGSRAGLEMVICADGGAKTIVLDADGTPVETSGEEEPCPGHGPCCTLPAKCPLSPGVRMPVVWLPTTTVVVFHIAPAGLRSGTGSRPTARGPPSKDNA